MKKKLLPIALLSLFGIVLAGCTTTPKDDGEKDDPTPVEPETVAVESVALDKTEAEVVKGQNLTLVATVSPANATNQEVTWSSDDPDVASVSNAGVVTANEVGEANITVKTKDGNKTAVCKVTVVKEINSVSITNKTDFNDFVKTETKALEIAVDPADNVSTLIAAGALKISVADAEIATISGLNVTGAKEGTTRLTVSLFGKVDSFDLTVKASRPAPAKVNATPSEVMAAADTNGAKIYHVEGYVVSWGTKTEWTEFGEMRVADTADTDPTDEGVMYVYGSYVEGVSFTWDGVSKHSFKYTSRDVLTNDLTKNLHIGDKVTMDVIRTDYNTTKEVKGQILAVEKGAWVDITGLSIKLNGEEADTAEVYAEEHLYLAKTVNPDNASNDIIWKSSDETVATVKDGWVKGLKAGTAKITVEAKDSDIKDELTLTVKAARTITNDGSAEHPFTVEEACSYTARLENNNKYDDKEIHVKGVILTSSWSDKFDNGQWTFWLADAQDNKAFEVYASNISDELITGAGVTVANAKKSNGLRGYELTAHGYPKNYNNTLEVGNYKADGTNYSYPTATALSKAAAVDATGLRFASKDIEVVAGSTETLTINPVPFYATAPTLVWKSSDETVATVAAGKVTGVNAGTATITAFVDADSDGELDEGEMFAEIEVKVIVLVVNKVDSPVKNTKYRLGIYQGKEGKVYYAKGTISSNYGQTSTKYSEGVDFELVEVTGGYNVKVTYADNSVKYMNAVVSGKYFNLKFEAAANTVWTYDETAKTLLTEATAFTGDNAGNNGTYFIGTNGNYKTLGMVKVSNIQGDNAAKMDTADGYYAAHFYLAED